METATETKERVLDIAIKLLLALIAITIITTGSWIVISESSEEMLQHESLVDEKIEHWKSIYQDEFQSLSLSIHLDGHEYQLANIEEPQNRYDRLQKSALVDIELNHSGLEFLNFTIRDESSKILGQWSMPESYSEHTLTAPLECSQANGFGMYNNETRECVFRKRVSLLCLVVNTTRAKYGPQPSVLRGCADENYALAQYESIRESDTERWILSFHALSMHDPVFSIQDDVANTELLRAALPESSMRRELGLGLIICGALLAVPVIFSILESWSSRPVDGSERLLQRDRYNVSVEENEYNSAQTSNTMSTIKADDKHMLESVWAGSSTMPIRQ